MKLSETIFGKKLNEITFEDLKLFFSTEREESSKLEFKSGQVEIEDIYREVCAFLNTDGGVIIIGSPREQKIAVNRKNSKRICSGELTPSKFQNKGWIIQKIAANISPFPSDLEVHDILTLEGNFFILEVPQSMTPPHQCLNEGKYYIRLEEEAKPAPHGIIQSLFFKRLRPKITSQTELTTFKDRPEDEIEINIRITNESDIPTDNISYLVNIKNIKEVITGPYHENSDRFKKRPNGIFILQSMSNQVLINRIHIPISFFIIHLKQPFIISTLVWGKDFGLYENSFLWDPIAFRAIDSFKTGESNNTEYKDLETKLDELIKKAL